MVRRFLWRFFYENFKFLDESYSEYTEKLKIMKDIFLKAKHWQLFVLIFVIPMIAQGIGMSPFFEFFQTIEAIENQEDISPILMIEPMYNFFRFMMFVTGLIGIVMLGWLWSVGVGLQGKIPEDLKMKTGLFKAALILPIVYFVGIFRVISFVFLNYESLINFSTESSVQIFSTIFSVHLLSIIAVIYTFVFVAKTVKTAELQRKVKFEDFIGEFFMACFYMVGVWILQPRINEIYSYKVENHEVD